MKLFVVSFYILIFCSFATAQRNAVWVFGDHGSWDFRSGSPQVFDSTAISILGPDYVYGSSICDSAGNLLFYTDGYTVWNNKHKEIPKHQYRWPWTDYVMPLICPYLSNDSLFYIFGVSRGPYANRLQYLTIKMKSRLHDGEIVYPVYPVDSTNYYEALMTSASVFVAGTHHCNKTDIWIVGQAGNTLQSFLVTKEGVSKTPVISTFPAGILPDYFVDKGNLKFSPSGEKMILPLLDEKKVIVFEFNLATGVFSNPLTLNIPNHQILTDAEFSPDGNLIYFAHYWEDEPGGRQYHTIANMNLNLPTVEQIEASYFILNNDFPDQANWCTPKMCYALTRTLSLGPDGKIYFSMRDIQGSKPPKDNKAGVIEYPNELGLNSFMEKTAVDVGRQYKQINYNYIRSYNYTAEENGIQLRKNVCSDKPVSFSLLYQKVDNVKWDFGDPASGSANYSEDPNPEHTYPGPGTYKVKAIFATSCITDTAYTEVNINATKSVKAPAFKDTVICLGSSYIADAKVPYATSYLWNGGNIDSKLKITAAGTYAVRVQNGCSVDQTSFSVSFEECPCTVFVPTAFSPNNDGLNDRFKPHVSCHAVDYTFRVYDRFGQTIFSTTDYQSSWDGKRGSFAAPAGSYVWVLEYTNPNNKKRSKSRGMVTLIR